MANTLKRYWIDQRGARTGRSDPERTGTESPSPLLLAPLTPPTLDSGHYGHHPDTCDTGGDRACNLVTTRKDPFFVSLTLKSDSRAVLQIAESKKTKYKRQKEKISSRTPLYLHLLLHFCFVI